MVKALGVVLLVIALAAGLSLLRRPPLRTQVPPPDGRPIKLFILAGQSNMVGHGNATFLPPELREPIDRVYVLRAGRWSMLKPYPAQRPQFGIDQAGFGPELTFGRAMAEAYPQHVIGVVKVARGGTSMLAWSKDFDPVRAEQEHDRSPGPMYQVLIEALDQAMAGRQCDVAGLIWMQGEADGLNADAAAAYRRRFERFLADLREHLDEPNLPAVLGLTNANHPHTSIVRQAKRELAVADSRIKLIDTVGLSKHTDQLHYDTAGQIELGRRFARGYLELIGNTAQ